jgi:hypothetical protein
MITGDPSKVHERYDGLLPPGSFRHGEESAAQDVLHEEHPLLEAINRWDAATLEVILGDYARQNEQPATL